MVLESEFFETQAVVEEVTTEEATTEEVTTQSLSQSWVDGWETHADGTQQSLVSVQGLLSNTVTDTEAIALGKTVIDDIIRDEKIDRTAIKYYKTNQKEDSVLLTIFWDIYYIVKSLPAEVSGSWSFGSRLEDQSDLVRYAINFTGTATKGQLESVIIDTIDGEGERTLLEKDGFKHIDKFWVQTDSITQQSKDTTTNNLTATGIWYGLPADLFPTIKIDGTWDKRYSMEEQRYIFKSNWVGSDILPIPEPTEHNVRQEMNEKIAGITMLQGIELELSKTIMDVYQISFDKAKSRFTVGVHITMKSPVITLESKKSNLGLIRLLIIAGFGYSGYQIFF